MASKAKEQEAVETTPLPVTLESYEQNELKDIIQKQQELEQQFQALLAQRFQFEKNAEASQQQAEQAYKQIEQAQATLQGALGRLETKYGAGSIDISTMTYHPK